MTRRPPSWAIPHAASSSSSPSPGQAVTVHYLKHRLLQAEAVQRCMAERDPLTGLYNRRSFDDALARATAAAAPAALVLFDFDNFKAVNDDLGHPTGDAVLRAVAKACTPRRPRRRLPGPHRRRRVRR